MLFIINDLKTAITSKEKYMELLRNLYTHGIIDDKEINDIKEDYDYCKDYDNIKDKDDFEIEM